LLFTSYAHLASALLTAATAGALRGITGFGSSLVLAPVLSIILPPTDAVAITLLIGFCASFVLVPRYLNQIDWPSVSPLCVAGLAFVVPGIVVLKFVDAETMRYSISWTMIVISLFLIVKPRVKFRPSRWISALAGALGGIIMGATSMGGPPVVLYLVGQDSDHRTLKANIVAAVGILELGAIGAMAVAGQIDTTALLRFAILLPAFALFMYVAEIRVGPSLGKQYQTLVLLLLLIIGVVTALM
jgi:uncharacterized membrane protein YfcA